MEGRQYAGFSVIERIQHRLAWSVVGMKARLPSRGRLKPFREVPVVVSMTSFPARIESTWMAVESIFRQSVAPDRVVLVLSSDEFPDRRLPERLVCQEKRGLETMWVEGNMRGLKKLIPTRAANPDAVIITVDDDMFYRRDLLERLLAAHDAEPQAIICLSGLRLEEDDGGLRPFREFEFADRSTPPSRVVALGGSGVLYPPKSTSDLLLDVQTAVALCPTTDDLWFWAMARLAQTPIRCIGRGYDEPRLITLKSANAGALWSVNGPTNEDEAALRRLTERFDLLPLDDEEPVATVRDAP